MAKIIICKECGKKKPHHAKGLCKKCYMHKWIEKNPEYKRDWAKENPEYMRKWARENLGKRLSSALKCRYNITLKEYDEMLELQDDQCAICSKTTEENGKRLCVDHDHETGEVRGLLCHTCNKMLGLAQDSPIILTRGTEYLLKWRN